MDFEGLSDDEKWERVSQVLNDGKGPRPGRPRKDGSTLTWGSLGLTRMEVHYMRLLARIPDAVFMEGLKHKQRGRFTRRGLLVRAGVLKNVSDENVFEGTEIGELARGLLARAEGCLLDPELSHRNRRWLVRALHARLREIEKMVQLKEDGLELT